MSQAPLPTGAVELAGDVLLVRGCILIGNAQQLADAGVQLLGPAGTGRVTVDFSAATDIDSSALAVLFSWQRRMQLNGGTLAVCSAPEAVHSLAKVYGVSDQLVWA